MTLQGWLLLGVCMMYTTCAGLVWLWARKEGMWNDQEGVSRRMIEEYQETEGETL
jgi:nitrogen fixation-related uncharacterized protein